MSAARKLSPSDAKALLDDGRLTLEVPEAGALWGMSKNAAYAAAKRGDFPVIVVGKRKKVPKIPFMAMTNGTAKAGA
jgi:hypothetical protein